MKFTTKKKLDESLMGIRVLDRYRVISEGGESADGMRYISSTTNYYSVYGNIENEVKNSDGTYTYDYTSGTAKDEMGEYFERIYGKFEPNHNSSRMIKELIFDYNIHEFSTDLQKKPHNIKDYYTMIDVRYPFSGTAKVEIVGKNIKSKYEYLMNKSDKEDTVSIEEIKEYFAPQKNYISYFRSHYISQNFESLFGYIPRRLRRTS